MSICYEEAVEQGRLSDVSSEEPGSSSRPDIDGRQAEKMRLLGQMTNEIAHDFNNNLQVIASAFELIHRRAARGQTADIERQVERAKGSVRRAGTLIRQLLEFSRPQAGGATLVDVNIAIASMAALLRTAMGRTIDVRLRLADDLPPVRCDVHQLENVLLNLAVNARDAMPDGGILAIETVSAALAEERASLRPGRYVHISVSDTGQGMAADVVARAFDPYFTTKPGGRGTGLGLSSVRSFTRRFQGHADIDSAPGEGTSIRLYLPCAERRTPDC